MKKLLVSIILIVPIFFGQPKGYTPIGGWCTPNAEGDVVHPFSLEGIWRQLKREYPKADALINFTFTPLKRNFVYPIYCGDVARKASN